MYQSIILITSLFFLNFSFAGEVEIIGKIENGGGQSIYLNAFINNHPVSIDSAVIKKNGSFKLSANTESPHFYSINLTPQNYALVILDGKSSTVEFEGHADSTFLNYYKIKGSKDSELIRTFVDLLKKYQLPKKDLSAKMYSRETSVDEREKIKSQIDYLDKMFNKEKYDFVRANNKSLAVITALSYLNPQKDLELYKLIEQGLGETVPGSEYHIAVQTQLQQIETQLEVQKEQEKERAEMEKRVAIGAVAPELNFQNPEGKIITIESLRGNYVLIDFWASWCGPCRRENPNVVKLYNQYKERGFTVYSVSLDKNKERWIEAIEQDNLTWPNHVSDLKQWQSEAVKIYGFRGIPFTVLIDKEGKIIEKNLRGKALEDKLHELLGN